MTIPPLQRALWSESWYSNLSLFDSLMNRFHWFESARCQRLSSFLDNFDVQSFLQPVYNKYCTFDMNVFAISKLSSKKTFVLSSQWNLFINQSNKRRWSIYQRSDHRACCKGAMIIWTLMVSSLLLSVVHATIWLFILSA